MVTLQNVINQPKLNLKCSLSPMTNIIPAKKRNLYFQKNGFKAANSFTESIFVKIHGTQLISISQFSNKKPLFFAYFGFLPYICRGEMAERSNAAVLKTVDCNRSGGSNPSLSAKQHSKPRFIVVFLFSTRTKLA